MTTVAVVAEFNPPHNGHAYLARCIRDRFGDDTRILAIMSGNFVQRGDVAIVDKYTRAELAISMGYNAVVELPFPFSAASARDFADAAVAIADKLGSIDYLCFGSESGELAPLVKIAEYMASDVFQFRMEELRETREHSNKSYIQLATIAIEETLGEEYATIVSLPNNILGISYIRALLKRHSAIQPITIKRLGSYHSDSLDGEIASASAIRKHIFEDRLDDIRSYVNNTTFQKLCEMRSKGLLPANISNIYHSIVLDLLKNESNGVIRIPAECDEALLHRIYTAAHEAKDFTTLMELCKAKHYTDAHIRRALLFTYIFTTRDYILDGPKYTALLAADRTGRWLLKAIKKTRKIPVLTKVADYSTIFKGEERMQAQFTTWSDIIYLQSLPNPQPAANALRISPYIHD